MSESQRTMEEIRESISEYVAENARLIAEIQALKEELEFAQTEARRWFNACADQKLEVQRY